MFCNLNRRHWGLALDSFIHSLHFPSIWGTERVSLSEDAEFFVVWGRRPVLLRASRGTSRPPGLTVHVQADCIFFGTKLFRSLVVSVRWLNREWEYDISEDCFKRQLKFRLDCQSGPYIEWFSPGGLQEIAIKMYKPLYFWCFPIRSALLGWSIVCGRPTNT